MKNIIDSIMIIDEASATVKKRSHIKITLIFAFVYLFAIIPLSLFTLVFLLIYAMFDASAALDLSNVLQSSASISNIWTSFLYVFIIVIPILYCTKYEKRRLFTLGFIKKNAVFEYLSGLLIGLFMFSLSFGIVYIFGGWDSIGFNPEISVYIIILSFLGFIIQGMGEEVLMRGYYMVSMATKGNLSLAIFASSFIFALLHVGNEGLNAIGLTNILLFGVFASLYFIRRGSIWGIASLHTAWNFAQGIIFGCPVSGIDSGDSIISTTIDDSTRLINGGEFGPEGGLAVTAVLIIGIVILYFMKNKEHTVTFQ